MGKLLKLLLACFVLAMPVICAVHAKEPAKPNPNSVLNKIVPVDGKFAGMTYTELAEEWLRWAVRIPIDPFLDPDGRYASVGQSGQVWHLVGNYGGTGKRTIKVPPGKGLFFPIVNTWVYDVAPLDAEWWAMLDDGMDSANDMKCVIDGVPVNNIAGYRVTSSDYGEPGGFDLIAYDSVTNEPIPCWGFIEGYWILVQPLSAGQHTLHFSGQIGAGPDAFKLDVTYNITVAVK